MWQSSCCYFSPNFWWDVRAGGGGGGVTVDDVGGSQLRNRSLDVAGPILVCVRSHAWRIRVTVWCFLPLTALWRFGAESYDWPNTWTSWLGAPIFFQIFAFCNRCHGLVVKRWMVRFAWVGAPPPIGGTENSSQLKAVFAGPPPPLPEETSITRRPVNAAPRTIANYPINLSFLNHNKWDADSSPQPNQKLEVPLGFVGPHRLPCVKRDQLG